MHIYKGAQRPLFFYNLFERKSFVIRVHNEIQAIPRATSNNNCETMNFMQRLRSVKGPLNNSPFYFRTNSNNDVRRALRERERRLSCSRARARFLFSFSFDNVLIFFRHFFLLSRCESTERIQIACAKFSNHFSCSPFQPPPFRRHIKLFATGRSSPRFD